MHRLWPRERHVRLYTHHRRKAIQQSLGKMTTFLSFFLSFKLMIYVCVAEHVQQGLDYHGAVRRSRSVRTPVC